jgi:methylenetetrahydrofolate reductase (NADPH)
MSRIRESDASIPPAQAGLSESIAGLALRASIETSTRNLVEIEGYASLLPAATDVYVSCLPDTPYQHILSIAKCLRQVGMNPVPHIAARRLANAAAAKEFLARLRDEAGVTRVLVIAGDSQAAVGPYISSLAVFETGLLQEHGIRSVGVAGYPAGHGKIDAQVLMDALDGKIEYARSHGIDLFVVSQFCFDGSVVLDWLAKLRARGVTLPVRVGVAGPATVRTLINYGMRCGIGDSLRAFGSQPESMTRLLLRHGPETVVRTIAQSAAGLGITGLHVFPFGGFAASARWIERVAAGRFRLTGSDRGFTLDSGTRAEL